VCAPPQGEQQFIAIEPKRLRPSGLTAEAQQRFCGLFWSKGDVGESTTRNIRAVSQAAVLLRRRARR
jgi:hypothetical protein